MSEALTAAAEVRQRCGEPIDVTEGRIRAWLEHPDMAGCDECIDGDFLDVFNKPSGNVCPHCVVVSVGDIPNVRVRLELLQDDHDIVSDWQTLSLQVKQPDPQIRTRLPAVEVSDTDEPPNGRCVCSHPIDHHAYGKKRCLMDCGCQAAVEVSDTDRNDDA